MKITDLQPTKTLIDKIEKKNDIVEKRKSEGLELTNSFASYLKDQLIDTNNAQFHAEELNKKLVFGEISNVHDVMIAGQKANMALEFTMQVRNLLMNAYNQLTMLR